MTLEAALSAIRAAPLRTLDDLNALLNAAHGRIGAFGGEFELAPVFEVLADMEHVLDNVQPIDRTAIAKEQAEELRAQLAEEQPCN
jgi:hypothetical protein